MTGIRVTDLNVASYRRLVMRNVIQALRDAFDVNYTREPEFGELRIVSKFPLTKTDYPAIVVEFQDQKVVNAGVGHVEWFPDPYGHTRKWNHSRFEGTLNLGIYALSPLDRDILADAIVEVIRFGRLDAQLNRFYEVIYPEHTPPAWDPDSGEQFQNYNVSMFGQLMLDSDQMMGQGNSAQIAPWQPEDVLVYSTGYSVVLHGGYYNTVQTVDYSKVTHILIDAYAQDQVGNDLPFPGHAEIAWNPAWVWDDEGEVTGGAVISADNQSTLGHYLDDGKVPGVATILSGEDFVDV